MSAMPTPGAKGLSFATGASSPGVGMRASPASTRMPTPADQAHS